MVYADPEDIDALMGESFPIKYVSDPARMFGATEQDIDGCAFLKDENPAAAKSEHSALVCHLIRHSSHGDDEALRNAIALKGASNSIRRLQS
ncbi:MAG: hypothetical protein MUC76_11395 [Spirochaetes bacterium]|nr:hypothetical protein [Spirochaetota bacterium]